MQKKHFGNDAMFSKKTILELVKVINFQTHNEVEQFCIEFDIEDAISGTYIKEKETAIAKHLIANSDKIGPNGSKLVVEIIEYAIEHYTYRVHKHDFRSCSRQDRFNLIS